MPAQSPLGKLIEARYGAGRVSLGQLMEEIQRVAGSGRKAAKMVGVGETTWRRWRSGGTTPKVANLIKVEAAVRAVRAANKPLTLGSLSLETQDKHDERERTLRGRQLFDSQADLDAVQNAYVADGPDAAASVFVGRIKDRFYRDYFRGNDVDDSDIGDYGGSIQSMTW